MVPALYIQGVDPRDIYIIEEAGGVGYAGIELSPSHSLTHWERRAFGQVFIARNKKNSQMVAVKIMKQETEKDQYWNELELHTLRVSQSSNVVNLIGAYLIESEKRVWVRATCHLENHRDSLLYKQIVTEFLNGGGLDVVLDNCKRKKKSISESKIAFVAKEVKLLCLAQRSSTESLGSY